MGGVNSRSEETHSKDSGQNGEGRQRVDVAYPSGQSNMEQIGQLRRQRNVELTTQTMHEDAATGLPRRGDRHSARSSSDAHKNRDRHGLREPPHTTQSARSSTDLRDAVQRSSVRSSSSFCAVRNRENHQNRAEHTSSTTATGTVHSQERSETADAPAPASADVGNQARERRQAIRTIGTEPAKKPVSTKGLSWRRSQTQTLTGWQNQIADSPPNRTKTGASNEASKRPFSHLPGAANYRRRENDKGSWTIRKQSSKASNDTQELCIPFQLGSCPFGNVCSRTHTPSNYWSQPSKPCFNFERTGTCKFGDRCKYTHDRPGLTNQAKHCIAVYKQFMQDETLYFRDINQAIYFVKGMSEQFDGKLPELLFALTAPGGKGMKRLRSVISMCANAHHIDIVFLSIIELLLCDVLSTALYNTKRGDLLLDLFDMPGLLEALQANVTKLKKTETLCRFLLEVCRQSLEARHSEKVRQLAGALRELSCPTSSRLCSYIVLRKEGVGEDESDPVVSHVPIRERDLFPPGNRHDNDFLNFRDISIIPTVDEISFDGAKTAAYLPLHSGGNSFFQEDPEAAYLDSIFRLYREDMVRSTREEFEGQKRLWNCSSVVGLDCGLEESLNRRIVRSPSLIFQLELPDHMKNLSKEELEKAWIHSRSLQKGSLVCLCTRDGDPDEEEVLPISFGTVVTRDLTLLCHKDGPFLGIMLNRIEDIVDRISDIGSNEHRTLCIVQGSSSFFSYESVLRRLQHMENVPFREELVHGVQCEDCPSYMLSEVVLPSEFGIKDKLPLGDKDFFVESVSTKTTLNPSQAKALFLGLSSRVALIQGPPGTGKSFVGSAIARTILENSSAKILCVCYTNHALDQVLEDLLENGVNSIVRIGGRSKSEKLRQHSVWVLAKRQAAEGLSRPSDKRARAALHSALEELSLNIDELQKILSEEMDWNGQKGNALQAFLRELRPGAYSELNTNTADDEGFHIIGEGGKRLQKDFLWKKWRAGSPRPRQGPVKSDKSSIWRLDQSQREGLIEEWRLAITADTREKLSSCFREFLRLYQAFKEQKDSTAYRVIEGVRVIGATTTGVAIHKNLIDHAGAEVLLVEEAGEILEAHTLSSLNKKVQHMILIGDHKQLRPKVESYSLTAVSGNGYGLDISLFEKLILNPNMESVMLQVQHRMRPEFSDLLRIQTYPTLEDAESTLDRPQTRGIRNNLLFLTHSEPESSPIKGLVESTSKSNQYESQLAVEIVRLLLLQGYKPEQIVILTPYIGQLRLLERAVNANLPEVMALVADSDLEELKKQVGDEELLNSTQGKGTIFLGKLKEIRMGTSLSKPKSSSIRIATVDNFQGEEADIVVVSLVRSNERGEIGFLSDAKRVNVLLSRARNSMFVIGNMENFRISKSGKELWVPLLEKLESEGNLKPYLESYCERHTYDVVRLNDPKSFRKLRPNGGCLLRCTFRMSCGHVCPLRCHPVDPRHERIECHEPCPRTPSECKRGHSCPKECSQDCGSCTAKVEATLPCGHKKMVECFLADGNRQLDSIRCTELLVHPSFADCDHKNVDLKCYESKSKHPSCPMLCSEQLPCGHQCSGRCGTCSGRKVHKRCREKCKRVLFCGHVCGQPCHEGTCSTCQRMCEICCPHSKCPNLCTDHCAPCMEPCLWNCVHEGQCQAVCGAPCVRQRCNRRCEVLLKCGHRCPSVCGETCPPSSFCQICANGRKKRTVVDLLGMTEYGDIDSLDLDPIVLLPCKHFYCMSTLDGHLELDNDGLTSEGRPLSTPKSCPECREVIHGIFRYGSVQNFAELSLQQRKHTITCERRLKKVMDQSSLLKVDLNLKRLEKLLLYVRRSPMQAVCETMASDKRHVFLRLQNRRIEIEVLKELARTSHAGIESVSESDPNYMRAWKALTKAIELADATTSTRSGAHARMLLAEAFLAEKHLEEQVEASTPFYLEREEEVRRACQWVIKNDSPGIADAVRQRMGEILLLSSETRLKMAREERIAVKRAIDSSFADTAQSGSNLHWYMCPNGHEYYIGECGRPAQEARCVECGLQIGGRNHVLVEGNENSNRV